MSNKFCHISIMIISILLLTSQSEKQYFDPWGVWNKNPVTNADKIKILSTGKYYEEPFGLYIVKHCNEVIATNFNFPAIAIPGAYNEIERYESIPNGFIFYLAGTGYKNDNGVPKFCETIRIQVKMNFINKDECYFTYDTVKDENGFRLSFYPEENVLFKRLRAEQIVRPPPSK